MAWDPASEEVEKALRESGFKKDSGDDYYYRIKPEGLEKIYADGNRTCQENSNDWNRHRDGDKY